MITLNGEFYLKGIDGDPVVFIAANDQPRLLQWWNDNSIFTQLFYHPYPTTKVSTPTIYFAKSLIGQLQEGDKVTITINQSCYPDFSISKVWRKMPLSERCYLKNGLR